MADTTTRDPQGAGATAEALPSDEDATGGRRLRKVIGWPGRVRRTMRVHWQFSLIVAVAVLVRAVVLLGYPPIMWFNDSFNYVDDAITQVPDEVRANGYPFLLSLVTVPWHNLYPLALLQAAMGVAMGIVIYALLRHRGLPWWGAALPALPVLLDVFELQLEHMVTADTTFTFLVTIALVICCWRDRPSITMMAVAGLLIGYATLVRSVGEPLLIVFIAAMLIRRAGWRQLTALTVAGVAPIAGYMIWFHGSYGDFALTESQGAFLYSRVSTFAECSKINPPADLRFLCDPVPTYHRPPSQEYLWANWELWPNSGNKTPLMAKYGSNNALRFTPGPSSLMTKFAEKAILAQPGDYVRAVYQDVMHTFGWSRQPDPNDKIGNGNGPEFRFSDAPVKPTPSNQMWWVLPSAGDQTATALNKQLTSYLGANLAQPTVYHPWAGLVQEYQRVVYLPGTLLGLLVLIGAAGVIGRWRPRPGRPIGGIALLPWLAGAFLIVFPPMTAGFSYRYVVAAVPAVCLAAALVFTRHPGERSMRALTADLGRYFGRSVPVEQE